ncbi:hypothetical protein G6539_21505, partial [Streptomyces albidoflavus]|nr:hypothetical protein [Streptomyces albidoflavus]
MAATAGWRGEGEDVGRETRQVFEAVGGPGGGAARAGGGPGGPVGPLIVTEDPVLLDLGLQQQHACSRLGRRDGG